MSSVCVLGVETSCDETSAAVVVDGRNVLSNVVFSQVKLHEKFRGVVPEIASRAHLETLDSVIEQALAEAEVTLKDIDAVAVATRPGLVGCLIIGLSAAKTLALTLNKPLVAVNHVHAHVTSPVLILDHDPWPAVSLVVSGGHTSLYYVSDYDRIELMGCTTDDACGEAFDKVASILGLGYPGGPAIDRVAGGGKSDAVDFPRSLLDRDSLDFSFSGIKTAVLYHVHGPGKTSGGLQSLTEQHIADIAASFQQAVVDVLVTKTMRAVEKTQVATVLAGGGVVANSLLRRQLNAACTAHGLTLHLAQFSHCTDNAAMIAAHGFHLLQHGVRTTLQEDVNAQEQHELLYETGA